MENQRHAPAGKRRMLVETEQFLHPNRQNRALGISIINRDLRAGRHFHMGRRFRVEPPLKIPRQKAA